MKKIRAILNKMNVECSDKQIGMLTSYMEAILKLNESVNLTAITDREEFIQKHYADSLLCAESSEFAKADTVIDVGTGAGFPGIPLAVIFPQKQFVLMDSLKKRINIIERLCNETGIKNVNAIHGRAEELARLPEMRQSFDLCVSRAVANMRTLAEYCLPFVRVGGNVIAYKGPDFETDLEKASRAISILGGRVDRVEQVNDEDFPFDHRLIFINKISDTPSVYPRKAGKPAKKPL